MEDRDGSRGKTSKRKTKEEMDGVCPGRSCYQEAEEERRGRPKEVEGHDQKQRPYLKWEKLEKEEESSC